MSEAASGPVRFSGTSDEVIDWPRANGVERVRVEYGDYGGVARGQGGSWRTVAQARRLLPAESMSVRPLIPPAAACSLLLHIAR